MGGAPRQDIDGPGRAETRTGGDCFLNINSWFFSSDLPAGAVGEEVLKGLLATGTRADSELPDLPELTDLIGFEETDPLRDLLLQDERLPELFPSLPPENESNLLQNWLESSNGLSNSPAMGTEESYSSSAHPGRMSASIIQLMAAHPGTAHAPGLSAFLPSIIELRDRVVAELRVNLPALLALNPSRREALVAHLEWIAGEAPQTARDPAAAAASLRRWIEGPRTPAREHALSAYLEEVALVCLGQAVLLKAWTDRGSRPNWSKADLGKLNWTLSHALKGTVPMDREGWQITRPNLYSWYNPGPQLQDAIWETLRGWNLHEENPAMLVGLLRLGRRFQPQWPELRGYDLRFFCSLWEKMPHFGFQSQAEAFRSQCDRFVYSPTLRDGAMVRTAPEEISWVGTEAYPFQLVLAELAELWWGPKPPPLWASGSGLDTHTREQMSFRLNNPKPSLISRIAEREDCELAFVLEERPVRVQDRTAEGAQLRATLDTLPYFKALRTAGTGGASLGLLQACVALSKLRPGGLLWWAREAPLSQAEGGEGLRFLLDRAQLLCEWDLAAARHTLPVKLPLFPKYLYLFRREPRSDLRRNHRPQKVRVEGEIRSHVEVPAILEEALTTYQANPLSQRSGNDVIKGLLDLGPEASEEPSLKRHDHFNWAIHHQVSPLCQQDWADRWPDPSERSTLRKLESLRARSLPLGQLAVCRALSGRENQSAQETGWPRSAIARQTVWVQQRKTETGRSLQAQPVSLQAPPPEQAGFIVVAPDPSWVAPLCALLESPMVREWLDHFCEQKGGAWLLTEQTLKFVPVPQLVADALKAPESALETGDPANERLFQSLAFAPRAALEELRAVPGGPAGLKLRARVFVRAARALDELRASQGRLFALVADEGHIRWREFMQILPKSERVPFQAHSQVRLSGSLPPHLPIADIQRTKAQSQRGVRGILLATEGGLSVQILCEDLFLHEVLWEQLSSLQHPTWYELTRVVELPRQIELAQTTATDVLKSNHEQKQKIAELSELMAACLEV